MQYMRNIGALMLLVSLLSMQSSFALSANSIGLVDLIQGEVYAISATGKKRRLNRNAPIFEGDTIKTIGEGAVVVVMADGTQWEILDESKLSIIKYQFTENNSGKNDGAIYEIHTGELMYISGDMADRGASIEIKTTKTSIYPQGTILEFITFLGVTMGKVVEGTARVVATNNGTPTADKVATEGMWFVKDASGDITVVKNKGQAQKLAKEAFQEVGVGKKAANKIAKIIAKLVKKGILTIEVDKDEADLLVDTPAESGGETLVASPS